MPKISRCRSCGSDALREILDLGETPLANALLTVEDLKKEEKTYPLILLWCEQCTLLQISENVPAEILFGNYFYRSSFSDAFLAHCKKLAESLIDEKKLNENSLAIDIASNDGYLLQYYREKNISVLGVEPAKNIADIAMKRGIDTRNEFFTASLSKNLPKADIVHAHNVLPHVGDQRNFIEGIKTVLKPQGIAVLEFAYAIDTIDRTEFDQIYHEHMCYFSLTSLKHLVERAGLSIARVEKIDVHGGSLRVTLMHQGAAMEKSVTDLLNEEKAWGVSSEKPYNIFAERAKKLKMELVAVLNKLKKDGKRVAAYGASAKGCTLMHFCEIGQKELEYVVDRSTVKQGHYTPGTHLKIEPVGKLLADQPDFVLLLTWNFAEEIFAQQAEYRRRGGKFIVPVPTPRVIE